MPEALRIDSALLTLLSRLRIRSPFSSKGAGQRTAPSRGRSLEFKGHRPYEPGDDVRYIDWNLYARHGLLFLKEFFTEGMICAEILVDASRSMMFGDPSKLEAAKFAAAVLAYVALADYDAIRLWEARNGARMIGPKLQGKKSFPMVQAALESLVATGESDPQAALDGVMRRSGRPTVFWIGDLYEWRRLREAGLVLRSRGGRIDWVQILCREETEPSLSGPAVLCDAEGDRRRPAGRPERALAGYRRNFSRFLQETEGAACECGGSLSRVMAEDPPETILAKMISSGLLEAS